MLSPLFLWLARYRALSLVLLVCLSAYGLFLTWGLNNFTLLFIGGVGGLIGLLVPPGRIASRRHLLWSLPALLACVVTLPWLRARMLGYVVYIIIVFKCIADISETLPSRLAVKRFIVLLGEYVLFCYLSHILMLQLMLRVFWRHQDTPAAGVVLISLITCAFLAALLYATAAARTKFDAVDRAYRFVFA
jgi:hypothetical protein